MKFIIKSSTKNKMSGVPGASLSSLITLNCMLCDCKFIVCFFFCLSTSRDDFIRIPELAINPIGERIIEAFFMNEDSQ